MKQHWRAGLVFVVCFTSSFSSSCALKSMELQLMLSLSADCISQSCYVYRYKGCVIRADWSLVVCTAWPLRAALPQSSEYQILGSSCLPVLMMISAWEECTLDFASKYLYLLCFYSSTLSKNSCGYCSLIKLAKGSWDFFYFLRTWGWK